MNRNKTNDECIERIKLHIKRNNQINKTVARDIADRCDIDLKEVKELVIAIRKRMFLLKEGGFKGSRKKLLDLAVLQVKNSDP